jgi:two-component system, cell cycle response regulator
MMSTAYPVCLVGFTAFERSTLQAFLRTSQARAKRAEAQGVPSYVETQDAPGAEFVLIDADDSASMRDTRAAVERCIYIGAQGRKGQLAQVPRPINVMALLRLLDACVAKRKAVAAEADPVATTPPPPVLGEVISAPAQPSAAAPRAAPTANEPAMEQILVVDDSDVALRFMASCLGRFGFEVRLCRSGEEALQRVAEQRYALVFMDVTMPGLDGYQTCKLIKRQRAGAGQQPPRVVMLTSRGGMIDKMRGTLAGCDAYLTKPLQQAELLKVIGARDFHDIAESDTAHAPLLTP